MPRMDSPALLALVLISSLATACSTSSGDPRIAMLPADHEVEDWVQTDAPVLLNRDTDLYNQIDGAAPKYIDHGWVRGVYAMYEQKGRYIYVGVHDMGSPANAKSYYDVSRPVSSEPIAGFDNAVVDTSSSSYSAANAIADHYIIETGLQDSSDAARTSIELFTSQILRRAGRF